jgi:hypothetical protein
VSWDAPNDGSKRLSLPSYRAERPVALSQSTLEPCMEPVKVNSEIFTRARRAVTEVIKGSTTVRQRFDKSAEGVRQCIVWAGQA